MSQRLSRPARDISAVHGSSWQPPALLQPLLTSRRAAPHIDRSAHSHCLRAACKVCACRASEDSAGDGHRNTCCRQCTPTTPVPQPCLFNLFRVAPPMIWSVPRAVHWQRGTAALNEASHHISRRPCSCRPRPAGQAGDASGAGSVA